MSEATQEIGTSTSALGDFISEDALALELKKSPKTIARWRKSGRGPRPAKIGRNFFYRRSSISEWLISCEKGTKPARTPRQRRRSRAA
jgi:predicted DNA-binding transcriptional regulator AlpA